MGIFDKHLGKDEEVLIDGDTFYLKQLPIDFLPHFFKVMKGFSGMDEKSSMSEALSKLNDESLNSLKLLIEETLKLSYPNEDEMKMKQFGMKFMTQLMPVIFNINNSKLQDISSASKIEEFKNVRNK